MTGDEDRTRSPKRKIAGALSDCAGTDCGRGIIPRSRCDDYTLGQTPATGKLRLQIPDLLKALIQSRKLILPHAADLKHFGRPALMPHIQQQQTRGIGIIRAESTAHPECQVILGQHDAADPGKILRLMPADPEDFGGGKARERNIGRIFGELFSADHFVQIIRFFRRAVVVPQNGRTDHTVRFIQNDQAMHLPAKTDAGDL